MTSSIKILESKRTRSRSRQHKKVSETSGLQDFRRSAAQITCQKINGGHSSTHLLQRPKILYWNSKIARAITRNVLTLTCEFGALQEEERKTNACCICRDGRLLILLNVTMPSNIWLFDINNCSPTTSTADLSHHYHDGAITIARTSVDASISMDDTADGRPGNDSHSSSTLPTPSWPTLPASLKSQRTRNPIRAIVDPIVASAGKTNRDDGKDLISLAVSADCIVHVYPHSCPIMRTEPTFTFFSFVT